MYFFRRNEPYFLNQNHFQVFFKGRCSMLILTTCLQKNCSKCKSLRDCILSVCLSASGYAMRQSIHRPVILNNSNAFSFSVIFIRRGQKFIDTLQIRGRKNSMRKRRFPLWKLSLNVFIFALVNFAFVYAAFVAIFFQDSCYWRRNRYRRTVTLGLLRFDSARLDEFF